MKFLTLLCSITFLAATTLADEPPRKVIETRSYVNGWEADMVPLDILANALYDEVDATGMIFVYGANNELAENVRRRIGCFKNYMTQRRGIASNRIRVMSGGYRKDATIELWLVPKGAEAPKKSPTLGREDVRPIKRGIKYRCAI